jgi:hypothetical protein
MAHIERPNSQEEEHLLVEQRTGSQLLITGTIFFGMGMLLSIFVFSDLRQGTHLMLCYSGTLLLIGVVLMAIGQYKRSYNA